MNSHCASFVVVVVVAAAQRLSEVFGSPHPSPVSSLVRWRSVAVLSAGASKDQRRGVFTTTMWASARGAFRLGVQLPQWTRASLRVTQLHRKVSSTSCTETRFPESLPCVCGCGLLQRSGGLSCQLSTGRLTTVRRINELRFPTLECGHLFRLRFRNG